MKFIYSPQFNLLLGDKTPGNVTETIKQMEDFWNTYGTTIQQEFSSITGLALDADLKCYLNTKGSCSDPLSLKIEDVEDMKDNLIHELLHVLFMQNYDSNKNFAKKWDKYWDTYELVGTVRNQSSLS